MPKVLGYSLPIVALVLVAGFIAYKKFVKKDLWGDIMQQKRNIKQQSKKEKKNDKKEYWENSK